MKFGHRVMGIVFLCFSSLWIVVIYTTKEFHSTSGLDDGSESKAIGIHELRRSLNAADSNSREFNGWLKEILDQSKSGQFGILKALLSNRSVAEAWIKVGHILEQHNSVILSVEDQADLDQNAGQYTSQNITGRQNDELTGNKIQLLVNILYKSLKFDESHRKNDKLKEQLNMFKGVAITHTSASFQRFQAGISRHSLYSDQDMVNDLLVDLGNQPITAMIQMEGGTQLKLKFTLADKSHVVFKPMRFPREVATLPNHFYFSDYERHIAEIAAFHLDRLLDFRKVPPVSGRVINITNDVWRLAKKDKKFEKTFFISPAGNVCFHGKCDYYCDSGHAVCGHPDLLEGSMAAFLPTSDVASRHRWRHPWRRSYSKRRKAKWEIEQDYCNEVRQTPPYNEDKRMLDLMDIAVFDFLTGNMDRHHYETFVDYHNNTFTLLFDNGRGFGKPAFDDMSILAPLTQCCIFRASTLHKLLKLQTGKERLGDLMRQSLAKDPLPQVLIPRHLAALNRRVERILLVVNNCVMHQTGHRDVIIDDGF